MPFRPEIAKAGQTLSRGDVTCELIVIGADFLKLGHSCQGWHRASELISIANETYQFRQIRQRREVARDLVETDIEFSKISQSC